MALLTAEEIVNKQFTATKFREGYDIEEVDDFLDEVVRTLSAVHEDNADLKAKLDAAEKRVAELSRSEAAGLSAATPVVEAAAPVVETPAPTPVQNAATDFVAATTIMQKAQEVADATVADARKLAEAQKAEAKDEALRVVSEARTEGARIVREAEETSHRTLTQLEQERGLIERKIDELRLFDRDARTRMKSFLQNLLNDVDSKGDPLAARSPQQSSPI